MCELGPELLDRATKVSRVPVRIALADRDFEDWIYASAETLGIGIEAYAPGHRGQSAIREALRPRSYTKPVWQPKLAAKIDIGLAAGRNPSLSRMLDRFDELYALLPAQQGHP